MLRSEPRTFLMGVPLPITAEIDTRLVPHRERRDSVHLRSVRALPVILTPCRLARTESAGVGRMQSAVLFTGMPGPDRKVASLAYPTTGFRGSKNGGLHPPYACCCQTGPSRDKGELPGWVVSRTFAPDFCVS
jgi:hypothetical protein